MRTTFFDSLPRGIHPIQRRQGSGTYPTPFRPVSRCTRVRIRASDLTFVANHSEWFRPPAASAQYTARGLDRFHPRKNRRHPSFLRILHRKTIVMNLTCVLGSVRFVAHSHTTRGITTPFARSCYTLPTSARPARFSWKLRAFQRY